MSRMLKVEAKLFYLAGGNTHFGPPWPCIPENWFHIMSLDGFASLHVFTSFCFLFTHCPMMTRAFRRFFFVVETPVTM
jgi:hypothetical protein